MAPEEMDVYGGGGHLGEVGLGLGLELPFIAEQDFAYYPRDRRCCYGMVCVASGVWDREGDVSEGQVQVRKGGLRFKVRRLFSRLVDRIGGGRGW